MRQSVIILLLAMISLNTAGQGMVIDKSGARSTKKEKQDTITLDKLQYRITYKTRSVKDTTAVPYKHLNDEMRLDIGQSGVSRFYSQSLVVRQEALKEMYKAGNGFDMTKLPKGGYIGWELYKNYPAEGKTLLLDKVGSDEYQCEEPIEAPEWEIVPDSVQEILGYQCQMATSRFKGRQWSAWFTEDIPLDEGPWKLRGLPGLVLRAYDAKRQYVFDGAGLEQPGGDESVILISQKREKISQKDLRKLRNRYDPMASLASKGIKIISVKNADGSDAKLPNRIVSNSIELDR